MPGNLASGACRTDGERPDPQSAKIGPRTIYVPVRRRAIKEGGMARGITFAIFMAAAVCVLLMSIPAHADSACLSDAQRYCAQIPIGEGRVLTCLQARWNNLSGACQQEIQHIQNRAREI